MAPVATNDTVQDQVSTGPVKNGAAVSGVDGTLSFKNNTVSGSYTDGLVISATNRLLISGFANNVFYDRVGYRCLRAGAPLGVIQRYAGAVLVNGGHDASCVR